MFEVFLFTQYVLLYNIREALEGVRPETSAPFALPSGRHCALKITGLYI